MAGDQKRFQTAMIHAEKFSQQANWGEAARAYRFALAEFPNNEAAITGFGKASLASGNVDFAERAFEQALKINPTNHEALQYLGEIQEKAGRIDAAAETYLRVGNMYAGRMDLESGIEFWQRSIALVPTQTEANRRLANAFVKLGQPRRAVRELLTLAAVFQQHNNRDQALQQIREADQLMPDEPAITAAYEALENGLAIDPKAIEEIRFDAPASESVELSTEESLWDEDPFAFDMFEADDTPKRGLLESAKQDAMAELANVAFEDGANPNHTMLIVQAIDLQATNNLFESANNYQKALREGMKRPALYFNLGILWSDLNQVEQAVEMFNISTQDRKYGLASRLALGEMYRVANKLDLALKYYAEVMRLVDLNTIPSHKRDELVRRYDEIVKGYLSSGNSDRINVFIDSLKSFFSHPAWEKRLIEARQLMDGVTENGLMSLAEYLETPATEVIIRVMALTNQYVARNFLMTASEECLRAIQRVPEHLPLHIRLADILLQQDHTDEAIAKYLYIARVYQMRGTSEEAIGVYEKVLRLAPMDVTVRAGLIDIYISQHELEKALDEYLILANSYYQLAQVDRSLEKYNEALRLTANMTQAEHWRVEILGRMGDIYNQRFDWAGATTAYEELDKIKPNDEKILRKLIDFYYKQNKFNFAINTVDKLLSLYQRQNPLKTTEFLKELSAGRPEDTQLRQRMAIAYAQNGMTRQAIAEYDALGEMQLESGHRDEAIQTIQAIINLGPDDVSGYKRLLSQLRGGAM